jgi:energy-coupling factor transporter ATP-binding protein EcfA2
VRRLLIAYDRDEAGDAAAAKLAPVLEQRGIAPYRVLFPKGMDANDYAVKVGPPEKSLGLVLRKAEFMGQGPEPQRTTVVPAPTIESAPSLSVSALAPGAPASSLVAASPMQSSPLAEPSSPAPVAAIEVSAEVREREVVIAFGERRYRVRGLDKNLAHDVLKVNLLVSGADGALHVDTFDLYQAKARALFARQAALELGVEESVIQRDLGRVLLKLEALQDAAIQAATQPKAPALAEALSPEQHDAALALLRDPKLIERIVADVEAIGVVGEASNALVGYLACVSRKLDKPLAVLIQSTSAAGKSTLMDALLSLMPEPERVHYSAMTGQSLFYLGEGDLRHKILAIAEEEGVRQASYALKLLQSQGELTIASTGKDPATGKLVTEEYRVEGPVMLFLTTTAIDLDEELLNRCLVLTINESREQTAAIQARQRASRTLDGLLAKVRSDEVLGLHRAAQRLLKPLAVVNPYAQALTFASDRVRMRRDHQKYLALIDAIALLHQHQRPIRSVAHGDSTLEYVEATLEDIALANRLAHEVLGRSLDELPPQTRRVLGLLDGLVRERAQAAALPRSEVRFTRREVRALTGLSDTQARIHLDRLVQLDYVLAHAGRNGQRFVYELAFDGDVGSADPQFIGLLDVDAAAATTPTSRGSRATSRGEEPDLAARSRGACGPLAATSRSEQAPLRASAGADLPSLEAASEQTALLGTPRVKPRRNGSAASAP